ncbi:expressed unknown protein [Seminavis robusta]|uniref:Sey1/RHD3-like three-helix bundle domain-containing protein n=1 Tax=Seminavis robusta TaxID=568900 RepID=A0A9N8ECH7_9STRA|nr:expressed unknown protein [Seminavis robusta]|eukprot:Sro971_g226450.1 n/a (511) ;mRNA; r:10852-12448
MNALLVVFLASMATAAQAASLMDGSGNLKISAVPQSLTSESLLAVISNPDLPSSLSSPSGDDLLSLDSSDPPCLSCRGPTLSIQPSDPECVSISLCSLTASAIVVDGITEGDVEAGLLNSRHAVTLSALFRARALLGSDGGKQSLLLSVNGEGSASLEKEMKGDLNILFLASVAEAKESISFDDAYDLKLVFAGSDLKSTAKEAAQSTDRPSAALRESLQEASSKIDASQITSEVLDPPQAASALVAVGEAHSQQARSARVKFAAWRSRAARGLLVDNFGAEASDLRQKALSSFEAETLAAAGLPTVASYRATMRKQLQSLVDGTITEVYQAQLTNLEKQTVKKLRATLLKNVHNNDVGDAKEAMDNNAAALRAAIFTFESSMDDLEVPSLGLSKEKAVRDMTAKLNDEVMSFPDSAPAKLKRAKQVKKVVSKNKKPTERAISFGLDVVAMLRPDGFGSLQGFAGYQLGGNSLTFGVHNDADDPQVISQFGGVRPPLLRVQPKLRVDVEM